MELLKQLKIELEAITQESINHNLWYYTKKTGLVDRIIQRITAIEEDMQWNNELLRRNKNKKGA